MPIQSNKILKRAFFLALCLIAFLVIIKYSDKKESNQISNATLDKQNNLNASADSLNKSGLTKKQQWQNMEKEVASWVDGLGLGIDPGIKNTVIVLNLLGFKTSASCEGHMDRALAYPWVDFETENQEVVALNNQQQDIVKRIEEKQSEIQKKYPDLSWGEALRKEESEELNAIYPELHAINDKIEKLSKVQLVPLKNLLADFYKNRSIDPDKMITIQERAFLRMYSLGGDWQIVRDDNERLKKLKEYQQEMKLLTDFLTDHFLSMSNDS